MALALLYVRCREQEGQSSIKRMVNKKEEGGVSSNGANRPKRSLSYSSRSVSRQVAEKPGNRTMPEMSGFGVCPALRLAYFSRR